MSIDKLMVFLRGNQEVLERLEHDLCKLEPGAPRKPSPTRKAKGVEKQLELLKIVLHIQNQQLDIILNLFERQK
jgi:hypothetical protein